MEEFRNVLLVSGSARNVGKTSLACAIITKIKKKNKVYGLKISPHFHETNNKQKLIIDSSLYRIYIENDHDSDKDTSRMLKAGADTVYFIQCEDVHLPKIKKILIELIPSNLPTVCESGSFANHFKPGFHVLVNGQNGKNKTSLISNINNADIILTNDSIKKLNLIDSFHFTGLHWELSGMIC